MENMYRKTVNFGQKDAFFHCFSPITLAILVFSQNLFWRL